MSKKQINSSARVAAILFTVTYMVSYITRINYGAIVSEMGTALNVPKTQISMALTGSFITYGLGQLVSGVLGDRFSPKKLVFYGLCTTTCMNLLLPLCASPWQMLIVWCVNGFAQSFMWPPMVRLMAVLSPKDYTRVSVRVSWGSSFGTIAVYLLSPLLLSLFDWRAVFFCSALCSAIMAFLWNCFAYDVPPEPKQPEQQKSTGRSTLLSPLIIGVMAAIVLQGMLRDGVTTWMPSYISETYQLSNQISILTGVTLPLFGILCLQLSSTLYTKVFKSPVLCSAVLFCVGAVASLGLCLFTGGAAGASVLLSAVLTGCMHGVNLMLICMIPPFFKKHGNVSTVSGMLNFCTYIGSALSTYGIAVLSEHFGWNTTLLVWLGIACAGAVVCLVCCAPWKRSMASESELDES